MATYLTSRPNTEGIFDFDLFFSRCCSLFPYYDVIQTTDPLPRAPTETQSFWTFSPSPLSVCNNGPGLTPLLPLLWRRSPSMEFGRRVRHIITAQATQTVRGPLQSGFWWTWCHLKRTCLTCQSLTTVCVCQVEHWGAVSSFLSRSAPSLFSTLQGPRYIPATASVLASSTPEQVASGR